MPIEDILTAADEREQRAERWQRQISDRLLVTEPDWWLRMECGQVLAAAVETPCCIMDG